MSFVLGLDVGTSRVRCFAVGKDGATISSHDVKVEVLYPQPGRSEIDPERLWENCKLVITQTLNRAHLDVRQAACVGLTCQRNTFLLWERATGKPLCNFITWQDRRAAGVCRQWNESMQFKAIHSGANLLHFFSRSKRYLAASIVTLTTQQVAPRLYWALNNIPGAKQMALEGKVCFGTVDSWLLWKLTGGRLHATDFSCVSTTLLYDPFQMDYSNLLLSVLGIPPSILPVVMDTGCVFGHTDKEIFGVEIPITAVISDQTSSMFAQGCWEPGEVKCTLGTGMFLCVNTGSKPHASLTGFYPEIGWKIGEELVYLAEANFPSCGSAVEWSRSFGLTNNPSQSEELARSVEDSNGVCFVPAFDGIQAPHNDPRATGGIIGLTHGTRQEHVMRAVLESIAYTFKMLYDVGRQELGLDVRKVCVDGGVSKNNFVLQLSSSLLGQPIHRPVETDMTIHGAVYIAGLVAEFWESRKTIKSFWELDRTFVPMDPGSEEREKLLMSYQQWKVAVERCLHWYPEHDQDSTEDSN